MPDKKKDEIIKVKMKVTTDIAGKVKKAFVEECTDRLEKPAVILREIIYNHYKKTGKI